MTDYYECWIILNLKLFLTNWAEDVGKDSVVVFLFWLSNVYSKWLHVNVALYSVYMLIAELLLWVSINCWFQNLKSCRCSTWLKFTPFSYVLFFPISVIGSGGINLKNWSEKQNVESLPRSEMLLCWQIQVKCYIF